MAEEYTLEQYLRDDSEGVAEMAALGGVKAAVRMRHIADQIQAGWALHEGTDAETSVDVPDEIALRILKLLQRESVLHSGVSAKQRKLMQAKGGDLRLSDNNVVRFLPQEEVGDGEASMVIVTGTYSEDDEA